MPRSTVHSSSISGGESAEVAGGGPVLDRVAADLRHRRALAPPLEHLDGDAVKREPDRGRKTGEAAADDPNGLHLEVEITTAAALRVARRPAV